MKHEHEDRKGCKKYERLDMMRLNLIKLDEVTRGERLDEM